MKRYLSIALLLCSLLLNAQQWHTTLDVLRPAERNFPQEIHSLLIVNNTIPQPMSFGHSVLTDGYAAGNVEINLQQATAYMLFAVTETLEQSDIFHNVGLLEISQNQTDNFYRTMPLSQEQIAALCNDYQSDALLVCNRNVLFDALESFPLEEGGFYASLAAYSTCAWTLYYQTAKTVDYVFTDTLYWEAQAYTREQALSELPDRQTALLDMAAYVGERFAAAFVPQWETVDRYFYENDNNLIKAGMQSFTRQRWAEAIRYWEEAYQNKDKQTKAYAAANIAVTSEIVGDLETAIQWAQRAIDTFGKLKSAYALQQKVNLNYYLQQLRIRRQEQQQLSR
ncbi:MAG: DUF6340 family protein [Paludibacter sp.]|nr:DUF6340 family protein [Bacteroidales bacterium]MCM1069328.1 DUF6340 family protein [Prevotella sp.]MCM1353848.1 DUF6340 family protein [Bacteroides sp.]MCM1442902.1 DUF6340 family protein [Muribaculum sp.]MCM1481947.1 DUF6340 family protein [Paludibacter sp.]